MQILINDKFIGDADNLEIEQSLPETEQGKLSIYKPQKFVKITLKKGNCSIYALHNLFEPCYCDKCKN